LISIIHRDLPAPFSIPFKQFKSAILKRQEWAKGQKRLSLQGLYGSILSLLGLSEATFHAAENEVRLYNLRRLSQAISDYENSREYLTFKSIKDFLWFIRLHAENSYDSGNTDAMAGLVDAVQVMTMHGTKGLGFGFNPGIVPQLGFGKQVHNVINLLHKEYEDTRKIPSKKRIQELLDEHFYLRYASDYVRADMQKSARNSLERYVKMWEEDFTLSVKTERAFELEFDDALIAGSIDMIKRDSMDETFLEIIDFKTGKPDHDLAERYDLQVQLYTIAAREALGINTKKALIHYLDTVKNSRLIFYS
jgi:ATP-dependent exoDNAse (exonuclease V) beta subunit